MACTHLETAAGWGTGAAAAAAAEWWVILIYTALTVLLMKYVWMILEQTWWKPMRIVRKMQSQGITARPYRLLGGDIPEMVKLAKAAQSEPMTTISHDTVPRILPYLGPWCASHGTMYLFWQGIAAPTLNIADPKMIKDILSTKSSCFHRGAFEARILEAFLGRGILVVEDDEWTRHRRIINSAFHVEKLKAMVGVMVTSTEQLMKKWETLGVNDSSFEVEVLQEFYKLTMDVFSRTVFSNSYRQGKQIGRLQEELSEVLMGPTQVWKLLIPGYSLLPTSYNRRIHRLKQDINRVLDEIILTRLKYAESGKLRDYGNDLVGSLLSEAETGSHDTRHCKRLSINDVKNECQTVIFAGHDTTANLLTWTAMLLSLHPQWQERARKEVIEICNGSPIDDEKLRGFKILTMILQEVLRLYPAVSVLVRVAVKTTTVQGLSIPEGLQVSLPILQLHRDEEQWGSDALEFRPDRFAEGASKACKDPMSYIPFSCGQRTCAGQVFAMMEAKVVLATILQRFSLQLSPKYKHGPKIAGAVSPQYGMPIIFHKLT